MLATTPWALHATPKVLAARQRLLVATQQQPQLEVTMPRQRATPQPVSHPAGSPPSDTSLSSSSICSSGVSATSAGGTSLQATRSSAISAGETCLQDTRSSFSLTSANCGSKHVSFVDNASLLVVPTSAPLLLLQLLEELPADLRRQLLEELEEMGSSSEDRDTATTPLVSGTLFVSAFWGCACWG